MEAELVRPLKSLAWEETSVPAKQQRPSKEKVPAEVCVQEALGAGWVAMIPPLASAVVVRMRTVHNALEV